MDRVEIRRLKAYLSAGSVTNLRRTDGSSPRASGEEVRTEMGFEVRRSRFPLTHCHGRHALGAVAGADPRNLAVLGRAPDLASTPLRDLIFFDTETTSLSGGAGAYVFLVGFARLREDGIEVSQYFMRDPTEEEPMLRAFNEELDISGGAVSYFGKNFDKIRIEDKMLFHRMVSAFPASRHLDLCHTVRAVYRGRLRDCRLRTVERHVLGHRRVDDLPGELCPQAYFDFLGGRTDAIERVFRHNLEDVLSLVVLTARMDALVREPAKAPDALAVARLYERCGMEAEARGLLERSLESGTVPAEERVPLLSSLSAIYRRMGEHDRAAETWEEILRLAPAHPFASVELAKHDEHRRRDIDRALAICRELWERRRFELSERARESLEKRMRRLEGKERRGGDSGSRLQAPSSSSKSPH